MSQFALNDSIKNEILQTLNEKAGKNPKHEASLFTKQYGCKNENDDTIILDWLKTVSNIKEATIRGHHYISCTVIDVYK